MSASRVVEKILRSLINDFESIEGPVSSHSGRTCESLEAHEQNKGKKHDPRDQALQVQLDLNETRNTWSRGLGGRGRSDRRRGDQGRGGQGLGGRDR